MLAGQKCPAGSLYHNQGSKAAFTLSITHSAKFENFLSPESPGPLKDTGDKIISIYFHITKASFLLSNILFIVVSVFS